MNGRTGTALGAPLALLILALLTAAEVPAAGLDDARSRFGDLVLARTHPGAAPLAGSQALRWNLRDRRQVLYRLEQTELETTTQRLDGASRSFDRESEADGTMVVYSRGGGLHSEVRMQDVTMRTVVRTGAKAESVTARLPILIASGLTEAGRLEVAAGSAGPSSVDNMVTGLFALPGKALRSGESEQVPVRFGAAVQWGSSRENMATYPVVVEGLATVTVAGRERLETCDCVRVDIGFDLGSTTPPKGFPGRLRVVVRGTARTWFDPGAGRMAEGELAMIQGIDIGAPDRPRDAGLSILTDTHTRVRIGR